MHQEERDRYVQLVNSLLKKMVEVNASDLFLSVGFPPAMKIGGKMMPYTSTPLTSEQVRKMAHAISSDKQWVEYQEKKGANFAIAPAGIGRFRVNFFAQQKNAGMVHLHAAAECPHGAACDRYGLESLNPVDNPAP